MNGKNAHEQIDSLILMNELNNFNPSSTSVDISVPSSEDLKNRTIAKNLANNNVGSIGGDRISKEEIFDIVSGLGPMGTIKTGRGIISALKNLWGKAKSKYKFPKAYGYSPDAKQPNMDELLKIIREEQMLDEILAKKMKKGISPAPSQEIKRGIRQVGKFNRQLQNKEFE